MPRQRSDKRDKAFEIWRQSGGKTKLKDIAATLEVQDTQIRKWKNQDKWDERINSNVTKPNSNVTKKRGAPKGSKNAKGNKGNREAAAPERNKNAERHGFFSRIMPDDPETMAIVKSIEIKSPLDILWENIVIQYTAIARAQKLMFVRDQNDTTEHLKREKESSGPQSDSWEKEYELQFAWDKHANFLQAQARAMQSLEKLIARYDEMLPGALKYEEQRQRVEKIKAEIGKIKQPENPETDDGFIDALKSDASNTWSGEHDDRDN
ncbi:phage terminase small subunit [Paradesulfitobacterium aromaticivorans]